MSEVPLGGALFIEVLRPPRPRWQVAAPAIYIELKRYLQLISVSKNCGSECAGILDDFRVEKSRHWKHCEKQNAGHLESRDFLVFRQESGT